MTAPDRWISSLDQPPPDDLERRLSRPWQRIPIIVGLFDIAASQRWLAEGPPDRVVFVDGDYVELLIADEDTEIIIREHWTTFFIEAWTEEADAAFEAKRKELLYGRID